MLEITVSEMDITTLGVISGTYNYYISDPTYSKDTAGGVLIMSMNHLYECACGGSKWNGRRVFSHIWDTPSFPSGCPSLPSAASACSSTAASVPG